MEFLKDLFGEEALTYEQLSAKVSEKGFKVADLSTGNYVSRKKYEDEIGTLNTTILDLNNTISTRDTDLASLQQQLEDGSKDNKTKVSELTEQLSKLQGTYETAKNDYEAKLAKQSYEFAVKEFANGQVFSSNAAKRDFINEMLTADLKMQDNTIMGATDFVNKYKETNTDAFVTKVEVDPTAGEPKPKFVQPTPPTPSGDENPFSFHFSGVR